MNNENDDIIECTAAGLRKMGVRPDYLVCLDYESLSEDWIFDLDSICGIPVIHFSGYIEWKPYSDTNCPILPCWCDIEDHTRDCYNFGRGYYENN